MSKNDKIDEYAAREPKIHGMADEKVMKKEFDKLDLQFNLKLRHGYTANSSINPRGPTQHTHSAQLPGQEVHGGLRAGEIADTPAAESTAHGIAGHALARDRACYRVLLGFEPDPPETGGAESIVRRDSKGRILPRQS